MRHDPFLELDLTKLFLSPSVDLARVESLLRMIPMRSPTRVRAMHRAITCGPLVPGATDDTYLQAVELMLSFGDPIPRHSVWLAYADQLTQKALNLRAQKMTRLMVELGGHGLPALRRAAVEFGGHGQHHADFLDSLT